MYIFQQKNSDKLHSNYLHDMSKNLYHSLQLAYVEIIILNLEILIPFFWNMAGEVETNKGENSVYLSAWAI